MRKSYTIDYVSIVSGVCVGFVLVMFANALLG